MLALIFAGFIGAVFAPWIYRLLGRKAGWLISLLPLGLFYHFFRYLQLPFPKNIIQEIHPWIPSLGINLAFLLDGLSLLFALMITGMGIIIIIFTAGYMEDHPRTGRLYSFLLMLMASMLGLVLSSNLICLFIFWELTSISSYFLIGFHNEKPSAQQAAFKVLLVTGLGGFGLLAGFLLLGEVGGSFHFVDLLLQSYAIQSHPFYLPIVLLILFGVFTKSAQAPFHFWLSATTEAPSPVNAYLHSATMVNAGIYLIARFTPILGGTEIWKILLISFGLATMLIGAYQSFLKTNLKQILAYSTVSVLGFLIFLLGIGTETSFKAAMIFLLVHALSKAALFLVAGVIEHSTGIENVTKLSGLRHFMPFITIIAMFAALSQIGAPFFLGYFGKALAYESILGLGPSGKYLIFIAVLANIFLVASILCVGIKPFFGKIEKLSKIPKRPPFSLWIGPMVLSILGILFGFFPHLIENTLIVPSLFPIIDDFVSVHLKLWRGIQPVLILSGLTLGGGILLFFLQIEGRKIAGIFNRFRFDSLYDFSIKALNKIAEKQTHLLQSGYLRYYLMVILLTAFTLIGHHLASLQHLSALINWSSVSFYEFGVAVIMVFAGIGLICANTFLGGVIALGTIGYSIAIIYIFYGAPDLAITQFIIETLMVILFLSIMRRFPKFSKLPSKLDCTRNFLIAGSFGIIMCVLVLLANNFHLERELSEFFVMHSHLLAHGRNIVNVILVDFRAFDTLGEITVLSIAGLGVFALLNLKPKRKV